MKRKRLTINKRRWIPGAIVVSVLLIIVGMSVEGAVRQQRVLEQSTEQLTRVQEQLNKLQAKNTTRDERLKILATLAREQQGINCDGGRWNAWLQQISSIKQKATECQATTKKTNRSITAVQALQTYLSDEKKILQQLLELRIDASRDNWQTEALKDAQEVEAALEKLSVVKETEPVLKASQQQTGKIIAAWQEFQTANQKQDKAAYIQAESTLRQTYAGIQAIADTSDAELTELVSKLQELAM